jgi:hypothetical protein
MRKRRVWVSLDKKRCFWPKYIDGDGINKHFEEKEVGDADALPGTLDGQKFHIFAMKEPDYTMMLMSTYGSLNERTKGDTARTWTNSAGESVTKRFKYREPFVIISSFIMALMITMPKDTHLFQLKRHGQQNGGLTEFLASSLQLLK